MHQLQWDEDEIATRVMPAFDGMRTQVMTSAPPTSVTTDEPSLAGIALPDGRMRADDEHGAQPRRGALLGWLVALALLSALVARESTTLRIDFAAKNATKVATAGGHLARLLPEPPASLHIDAAHEGIAVSVDGAPRGMLPLTLDLEGGTHSLRFDAGPRFRPLERSVALLSGERLDFGGVALELRKGQVRVDVTPEQAQVWLRGDEGAARALDGRSPQIVELAPGDYELVVARRGYRSVVRPLRVDATRPEQTVRIDLKPTDWARDDIWEQ